MTTSSKTNKDMEELKKEFKKKFPIPDETWSDMEYFLRDKFIQPKDLREALLEFVATQLTKTKEEEIKKIEAMKDRSFDDGTKYRGINGSAYVNAIVRNQTINEVIELKSHTESGVSK